MVLLYAAGALLFLPLATPRLLFSMNGVQSAALVFCCANMVLSYASFSEALAHVEASRLSALLASVPLGTLAAVHAASLLAPSLFAPEAVTVTGIIGAALVVCGSLMSSLAKS
jgi:drug/metabolite transporter (DMT)-like permease